MSAPLTAVTSPLTGRTVLLPADEAEAYSHLVASSSKQWAPATDFERILVQSLADTQWRLERIPLLEAGIYALGRREFADLYVAEDESTRRHLLDAKIYLTYERQLKNLSTQEARLRRQRDKDAAALREVQENRKRAEQQHLDDAARAYRAAVRENRVEQFDPRQFGFEYSLAEIQSRARELASEQIESGESVTIRQIQLKKPKAA